MSDSVWRRYPSAVFVRCCGFTRRRTWRHLSRPENVPPCAVFSLRKRGLVVAILSWRGTLAVPPYSTFLVLMLVPKPSL